jgi:hypothetical protein
MMFRHPCNLGLEGIVSERLDASYRSGRSKTWLKIKKPRAIKGRSTSRHDVAKWTQKVNLPSARHSASFQGAGSTSRGDERGGQDWEEPNTMHNFVARENIKHYRDQLKTEIDPKRQALLQKISLQEEDKLGANGELAPADSADAFPIASMNDFAENGFAR